MKYVCASEVQFSTHTPLLLIRLTSTKGEGRDKKATQKTLRRRKLPTNNIQTAIFTMMIGEKRSLCLVEHRDGTAHTSNSV